MQLINFFQDPIYLNDKGYSKEALDISQTIIPNFRYSIKNKGISSYKRHNKNTQPPFPLYFAVKFIVQVDRKQEVFGYIFFAGISLPCKSLLELTRDIAN